MLLRPSSTLPARLPRPAADAPPQQVAEYYRRMLITDGAVPESFSPFEPLGGRGEATNGSDYFFWRAAPGSYASCPLFPEEALARLTSAQGLPFALPRHAHFEPKPEDTANGEYEGGHVSSALPRSHRGGPLAFTERSSGDIMSTMYGPRHPLRSEDDLIAKQLAEVRQAELDWLSSLDVPADAGEELIREQALLMRDAQMRRGIAEPDLSPSVSLLPTVLENDMTVALASQSGSLAKSEHSSALDTTTTQIEMKANLQMDKESNAALDESLAQLELCHEVELKTVLAMSISDADDAALKQALEYSKKSLEHSKATEPGPYVPEGAEAGVDIPFITPKSLLDDSPAQSGTDTCGARAASGAATQRSSSAESGEAMTKRSRSKGRKGKTRPV